MSNDDISIEITILFFIKRVAVIAEAPVVYAIKRGSPFRVENLEP
jgi:hypothetical protein